MRFNNDTSSQRKISCGGRCVRDSLVNPQLIVRLAPKVHFFHGSLCHLRFSLIFIDRFIVLGCDVGVDSGG